MLLVNQGMRFTEITLVMYSSIFTILLRVCNTGEMKNSENAVIHDYITIEYFVSEICFVSEAGVKNVNPFLT